jgi:hypothetical protein
MAWGAGAAGAAGSAAAGFSAGVSWAMARLAAVATPASRAPAAIYIWKFFVKVIMR